MPKGQLERLWLFGGAIAALVMLLVGYLLFIGPQRSHTGEVNEQISSAHLRNLSLQHRIDTLRAQSKDLARYQAAVDHAQLALPAHSGMPDFLRSLQSIGKATLTDVSSLTVGTPVDTTSSHSQPSSSSASPAPQHSAEPAPASSHVYALPISAQVSGTVPALERFLKQLQSVQPRAILISQITLTSGGQDSSSPRASLALTMQAFVAPTRDAATPSAPASK